MPLLRLKFGAFYPSCRKSVGWSHRHCQTAFLSLTVAVASHVAEAGDSMSWDSTANFCQ